MRPLLIIALILSACSPAHKWTCAEILGEHPTPGALAVLPPHWRTDMEFGRDGLSMSVYDESGHKVCHVDPPRSPAAEQSGGHA
jgi:hypothetical protein